jgi:hypothetical protein
MTPSAASGCTDNDALSTSGSRSVLTASGASSDLWAQALQRLPTGDRAKLNSDPSVAAWAQEQTGSETLPDLLEQLHDLAKRNKEQYDTKSWSFKVHETARAGRTPKTGQWLLAHTSFREWRNCSASTILWLHGMCKFAGLLSSLTLLSFFMCRFFSSYNAGWVREGLTQVVPLTK